jgi:Protein of unknown function (DUF982)
MDQNAFRPLTIETDQLGNLQTIESVQGALDFLASRWPADNEISQERAIKMSMLALQGRASADVAREVFVEAAKQAGLAVHHGIRNV